jgi:superfamily II DNA or RNA helicase
MERNVTSISIGKTYVRLLHEIIPELIGMGYDVAVEDQRKYTPPIEKRIDKSYLIQSGIELRPYQYDTVNTLLSNSGGIARIATGGGKSFTCAALAKVYNERGYKVIVIVPSSDLVTQTSGDFRTAGVDAGMYSGADKQLNHETVVATWQSLQNQPDIMSLFNVVIVDECHGVRGDVLRGLINDHGSHIYFRYGVTGTMPKPKTEFYDVTVSLGEVLVEVTSQWLIENGYLAKIDIAMIETQEDTDGLPDYASEKSYISKNADRVQSVAEFVEGATKMHGNTLVLVGSIAFGKKLQKLIPNSVFLSGESEKDIRQEHYKMFEECDNITVIASTGIASTGISINRIFCLILVDTGKSFIRTIQSIGRGLRKSHDKNYIMVYDVYSKLKFSKKHASDRKKHYKEAGYPVLGTTKLAAGKRAVDDFEL